MKPIIIVMIATAILMLFLHHRNNAVNSSIKKAQPARPTGDKEGRDFLLFHINLRLRLFQ